MSPMAREYLAQAGSPTIATEVFPENESDGTQLFTFHCKRVLPTSEDVGRQWLIHSPW